jgi:hypothetical protein
MPTVPIHRASRCLIVRQLLSGVALLASLSVSTRIPTTEAEEPQPAAAASEDPSTVVEFERDILPILAEHCHACHGAERQESNYRLDVRSVAVGAGDSGEVAIAPGQPDTSRLLRLVSADGDEGLVMPPRDESAEGQVSPLSDAQRVVLRRWIEQGANWPDEHAGVETRTTTDHWSFQPVHAATPPSLDAPPELRDWVRTPLDAFILRQLQTAGLRPSPDEERRQLIRRLYLDLLGLPPSLAEVDAFVHDASETAYEQLVDRVLASPRYGERWARHWLDVIRFGESDGFETNPERPRAYPFRDYVIGSLNGDLPYDQFVREQIAGDAMGVDVATGFLVAGPFDRVKSPDINLTLMQRQDELADIINTTGTAFLGLTVGCARCHNHKFDPISQQDYYSIQAVFAGVTHGERPVRSPDATAVAARVEEVNAQLRALEEQRAQLAAQAAQNPVPAASGLREPVQPTHNVDRFPPIEARWVRFTISATAGGGEPGIDELEIFAATDAKPDPAPRDDELKDTAARGDASRGRNVALASAGAKAAASGTLPGHAIHQLAHLIDGQYGNERSWIADTANTGWVEIELPAVTRIERIEWGRDRRGAFADRVATEYRIEVATIPGQWTVVASSADRQPAALGTPDPFAFIARLPAEASTVAQENRRRTEQLRQRLAELQVAMPVAYIGTFATPGATHRLYRGDPMAPREQVKPDAIGVIGSLGLDTGAAEQDRRVALARWLTSNDNPLTARVLVNRIWQHHFGTGLVATPSDFGANGVPPSHPELLDWLAARFMEHDWSMKWLHRMVLMSSTYRQSSHPQPEGLAADAASRLLWRFPPRRLEAEAIRDCMLMASGSLNLQLGGKGYNVFEVIPETVHHYFPRKQWGPNEWRRMIYMTKIRQEQDAVFGIFDCPDGGQVMPNRSRSTTPLQALNLFNSDFVLQQAGIFAERLQLEAGDDPESQVRCAFGHAFGRDPDADETRWSAEFIGEHGLVAFCRAMLNANEFLFLD